MGTECVWDEHLAGCAVCRRAVRGRLAGVSPGAIAERCCGAGRPLYEAFVADARHDPDRVVGGGGSE